MGQSWPQKGPTVRVEPLGGIRHGGHEVAAAAQTARDLRVVRARVHVAGGIVQHHLQRFLLHSDARCLVPACELKA